MDTGTPKSVRSHMRNASARLRITHGLFAVFLTVASVVAALAAITVLYPHGFLVYMWSVKETDYQQLLTVRSLAGGGFAALSVFLAITAVGWFQCRRWAWFLLAIGLGTNLLSEVARAVVTRQWVDLLGVPVEGLILLWLTSRPIRGGYFHLSEGDRHK